MEEKKIQSNISRISSLIAELKDENNSLRSLLEAKDRKIDSQKQEIARLNSIITTLKTQLKEGGGYVHIHNERGAGRKKKQPDITPEQIRSLIDEVGINEAVIRLNMSKRTLYRRMEQNKSE